MHAEDAPTLSRPRPDGRTRAVREILHTTIPLSDGTRLAARMWMPADAGPDNRVPVVLEYIPYRKRDDTAIRDSQIHPYFAANGYAAVRVDMRGSGDSEGILHDEYLPQEHADALEVIAWLAAQDWSTGAVGMMGNSWGGFNSLQVAALRPPALKAIITSCSTDDRYADDIHWMGGCLLLDNLKWSAVMFARLGRHPDPELVGEVEARAMWLDRLEHLKPWFLEWIRHQRRDAFWKHGSVCEDFAAIETPTFAVGGWADGYTNSIPRVLAGLSAPRLAWIGQWSHSYPHMGKPGPAVGFLQEAVRWWDRWLAGDRNGIDEGPMLRAYIQDPYPPVAWPRSIPGRWVEESAWPSPEIRPLRLHCNAGSRLDEAAGPAEERTVLTPLALGNSGRWCPHGGGPDMPVDQRTVDGGALVFETEPLAEPLDLLGQPVVTLRLASDRPQAQVCVRLSLVAPGGAATRISYGLLNLSHRDGHEFPTLLEPGRFYTVAVPLNDVGQRFPAGHRLRIAIATSYWPIAWPSPDNATLTVRLGESTVDLPVRPPREGDGAHRPPVEVAIPDPLPVRRSQPQREERWVETDFLTGTTTSRARESSGDITFDETGWTTSMTMDQHYSIVGEDPLSARGLVEAVQTCRRGDWGIETRTRNLLTASATDFHFSAEIVAFENGTEVFRRTWDETIPRDHL